LVQGIPLTAVELPLRVIAAIAIVLLTAGPALAASATRLPRAGILEAIERDPGVCCRVAPIRLLRVELAPNPRFAVASTSGGNALEELRVILWRGSSRWAVIEYGTDIDGCGFISPTLIAAFVSAASARACPDHLRTDPFLRGTVQTKIQRAARGNPWLVNRDRGERVLGYSWPASVSTSTRFVTILARVLTPHGARTRFGLLRRNTATWSLVDVASARSRLGCGLLRGDQRTLLRLPRCQL
jgi:hypothetical protein